MGTILYGGRGHELDDRMLAHLKITIQTKLRRGESFLLSWSIPAAQGGGRISLWISPRIPLVFRFTSSKPVEPDPNLLQQLLHGANSPQGLQLGSGTEAESRPGPPSRSTRI